MSLPSLTCMSVLQPPWQLRHTLFNTLTLPGTSAAVKGEIFAALTIVSSPRSKHRRSANSPSLAEPFEASETGDASFTIVGQHRTLGPLSLAQPTAAQQKKRRPVASARAN